MSLLPAPLVSPLPGSGPSSGTDLPSLACGSNQWSPRTGGLVGPRFDPRRRSSVWATLPSGPPPHIMLIALPTPILPPAASPAKPEPVAPSLSYRSVGPVVFCAAHGTPPSAPAPEIDHASGMA